MSDRATTHSLERTSPKGKGTTFLGRCVLCGKEDLPTSAALQYCENPDDVTIENAVMRAVKGRW